MNRFVFAVAAGVLVASVGAADEKPAAAPATPRQEVVIDKSTVTNSVVVPATAPTVRRGLFGRLRNRGTVTTSGSTLPVTPGTVVPAPAPAPAPMPMPGTKTGSSAAPAAATGVVLTSGTVTSGTVVSAAHTEPTSARRGLFGRLRNR